MQYTSTLFHASESQHTKAAHQEGALQAAVLTGKMEALLAEQANLEKKGNLKKTLEDVQRSIDLLTNAREAIISGKYIPIGLPLLKTWILTNLRPFVTCNDLGQVKNTDEELVRKGQR